MIIDDALSVNFVDKDWDYNKKNIPREECIELFPGGISYCFRSGHIPPILITKHEKQEELMSKENKKYRIRKLTPRECFVLMGLTFEDYDKAAAVGVSNSQLYKQAGNGIVTNCVELLFEHLYKAQYNPSFVTFDKLQTN